MTWIKICGMTNLEDALVAVDAGADAVGFVFYEKSPRCVSVETAREICEKLPKNVEKVGVFVGETADSVTEISKLAALTAAQIYPDTQNRFSIVNDRFLENMPCPVIVAFWAGLLEDTEGGVLIGLHRSHRLRHRIIAMLLDSGSSERPGGTGKEFAWDKAAWISEGMELIGSKLIVAGGLTAKNVSEAMDILRPWGVDVASGVEARPGKKDPEKVRAFVRAVREYDRKAG